jgi:hypothetical protein
MINFCDFGVPFDALSAGNCTCSSCNGGGCNCDTTCTPWAGNFASEFLAVKIAFGNHHSAQTSKGNQLTPTQP